jgi:hypothetical protein
VFPYRRDIAEAGFPPTSRRTLLLAAFLECFLTGGFNVGLAGAPSPTAVRCHGGSGWGLAPALQRLAIRIRMKIQNTTKPGTSIGQSQTYDRLRGIQNSRREEDTTTAVMVIGGNDRLPIRLSSGVSLPFRGAPWRDEYRTPIANILQSLIARNQRVVWVGNPVCRDPRYSQDMGYQNTILQDVLVGTKAFYLDTWTAIVGVDGKYSTYGPALDGATGRLRLDDGIPSGYDILATRVLRSISPSSDPGR